MDQLPHNHNPEEQPTDQTQEISLGEMFASDDLTSINESPVELTDADPATGEGADPDSGPDHSTRNKVLIGAGAVVTAAALFLAGKAFGGGETTPTASPTAVGQETPQPSATTPDTSATTEQTPAPSDTSPTDLPTQTETTSIPVGVPTTPGATQPETTSSETPTTPEPTTSESATTPEAEEQRDELQPSVRISYFKDLIDSATKKELLSTYDDTPTGRSLAYYLSDNIILQKGLQEEVSAKGIHKYQKRLLDAYSKPEIANVLGTPLGIYNQDIINYLSTPDKAIRGIPGVQDGLLNNIAGAVHNPAYNTIKGVSADLVNTAFLSSELVDKNKTYIENGAERFFRIRQSEIVEAKTVNTLDGHKVDVAAVVSTLENDEVKLNWFVHVPLGDKLATQMNQLSDSSIFVPFASYLLAEGNQ